MAEEERKGSSSCRRERSLPVGRASWGRRRTRSRRRASWGGRWAPVENAREGGYMANSKTKKFFIYQFFLWCGLINIMPHSCGHCGRMFGNTFNLRKHEESARCQANSRMVRGKFKCPDCSALFSTPYSLKRHQQRYHTLGQTLAFACGVCDKRFSTRDGLVKHRDETHSTLDSDGFRLRDSAHKKQSQFWRLIFHSDIKTMDEAFFYAL